MATGRSEGAVRNQAKVRLLARGKKRTALVTPIKEQQQGEKDFFERGRERTKPNKLVRVGKGRGGGCGFRKVAGDGGRKELDGEKELRLKRVTPRKVTESSAEKVEGHALALNRLAFVGVETVQLQVQAENVQVGCYEVQLVEVRKRR